MTCAPTYPAPEECHHVISERLHDSFVLGISSSRETDQAESVRLPFDVVNLTALMARTSGSPSVTIGLVDGPVNIKHSAFASGRVRAIGGGDACTRLDSVACRHGTFIAGMLVASRNSGTPGICPDCSLLFRPLFTEQNVPGQMPFATPLELADAVGECINSGARIINLSLGLALPSPNGDNLVERALDSAMKHGVIVVAAAGNQSVLGSSAITRHPWVIPVVSCDLQRRPSPESNLGSSTARRGLSAPGEGVIGLGADNIPSTFRGTSVAAPFVTGSTALLWSKFPTATAAEIKHAMTLATLRRASVVPPVLDAESAFQFLVADTLGRRTHVGHAR
jgi:subtilisin family serine protease